jgi:hypothetical protein
LTVFTEWPSALTLLQTLFALVVFLFLPGYFIALARQKRTDFKSLLFESPAEAVGESVLVSALLLGFASMALSFSIGFSTLAIVIVEMAVLGGTWFYWTKTSKRT